MGNNLKNSQNVKYFKDIEVICKAISPLSSLGYMFKKTFINF